MQKILFSTEYCVKTMLHPYSETEKQTESMKKWQTNRQNERYIEIQTDIQTDKYKIGLIDRVYRKI